MKAGLPRYTTDREKSIICIDLGMNSINFR